MRSVLDASAVLALLQDEAGSSIVAAALPGASMSSVNLTEVLYKSAGRGIDPSEVRVGLQKLGLTFEPFEPADAERVGNLHAKTRGRGLSLADLACLALGQKLGARVFHAEHRWIGLQLGIELKHVRARGG